MSTVVACIVISIQPTTVEDMHALEEYPQTANIPGGDFTAIQGDDGLWTIKAVPILAEMEAGERRNRHRIDAEWMRQAIHRHRLREADGHLPAVHEEHHENGEKRHRVGFFRPTHVGQVRVLGRQRDALFADLVGVSAEDLEDMKDLRLPYRSVEVHPSWQPEIQSLALMESEAPHHKLPMLRLGEVQENPYVVALCSGDDSLFIVQQIGGGDMPSRKKKVAAKKESPPGPVNLADDDEPEEEENEDLGGAELDTKIKELQDSIPGLIADAIAAKIEEIKSSLGGDDNEPEAAPDSMEPAEQFSEAEMDKLKDLEAKNAEAAGRLASLEKKNRDRETQDTITSVVDSQCVKLRDEGWAVDDTVRSDMVKLAEGATDPASTVETFVTSYRKSTPQDPPQDLEQLGQRGLLTGNESFESLPEEVVAYREKGPDAFARAVQLHTEYEALASTMRGFDRGRETLADHLEINWKE